MKTLLTISILAIASTVFADSYDQQINSQQLQGQLGYLEAQQIDSQAQQRQEQQQLQQLQNRQNYNQYMLLQRVQRQQYQGRLNNRNPVFMLPDN